MLRRALFVFRRDLRLSDNTALIEACGRFDEVVPLFILDPRQASTHPYRSAPGFRFMLESLSELSQEIRINGGRLNILNGEAHLIIDRVLEETKSSSVFVNRDYTPFSVKRDEAVATVCSQRGVEFKVFNDSLLHSPEVVKKGDGKPYTVFTPFFKFAKKLEVKKPLPFDANNFSNFTLNEEDEFLLQKLLEKYPPISPFKGGLNVGEERIKEILKFRDYETERDYPSIRRTTLLSPHNKFGTISIRHVYHEIIKNFGEDHKLVSELFWRDFFTHIAFNFPHVFKGAFHKKYDALEWREPGEEFLRFKEGVTGFPIVDAGVRELLSTGWMHNRVRMIVASFLTKDLHISWREGERFFANHLVDYDPSVNNGSWQWAASTGCDAQPYFRIFNPWLQQQKFDPDCEYIKKWIPELASLTHKEIHSLEESGNMVRGYPPPIVDHSDAAAGAKALFASIS